jgi:hypothetical protein
MTDQVIRNRSHVTLVGDLAARLVHFLKHRPRLLVWMGLALTLWTALSSTASFVPVTTQWIERKLATPDEDIHNLYLAASHAEWRDVPGWFVGPWIYPRIGYYRPLTSVLYFLEYRAFGKDFTAYNRVTWLLHALNTGLLFLLVVSLFRERRLARVVYGLIAVLFFTTGYNSVMQSISFSLGWWPAQNDVLSLTFGLLALLLLDQYLVRGARGRLVGALVAFACAIGSKEMGYATLPITLALIWHRNRRLTWEMGAFAALGLFFWFLRKLVVPNPWGQRFFTDWVGRKALFYWGGPPYMLVASRVWWPLIAAAAILLIGAVGLKRRWPVITIIVAGAASAMLCAQYLEENGTWALVLEGLGSYLIARVLTYVMALILFWKYRLEEPGLFGLSAFVVVFIPILQFVGHHYLYWPGAFLALANACFCACLVRWAFEVWRAVNWTVPGWQRLFPPEAVKTPPEKGASPEAAP